MERASLEQLVFLVFLILESLRGFTNPSPLAKCLWVLKSLRDFPERLSSWGSAQLCGQERQTRV